MRTVTSGLLVAAWLLVHCLEVRAANVYFDDYHDTAHEGVGDVDLYSDLSGGQSAFRETLEGLGHTITAFNEEITLQGLVDNETHVLMIFDPETALSASEITAIHEWQETRRGGLWVVGGHPWNCDLATINEVIHPYGIDFPGTGVVGPDFAWAVGAHPVMTGSPALHVDSWGHVTTRSVAVCFAEDSENVCVGAVTDLRDYSLGRIAAWGDASTFKNKYFDEPEAAWVENMIDWLNVGAATSTPSRPVGHGSIWLTAFPNPFRSITTFSYEVPRTGLVTLRIVDVTGRLVRSVVDDHQAAGKHTATWSGADAAGRPATPGIYFVRLEHEGWTDTERVVLIR